MIELRWRRAKPLPPEQAGEYFKDEFGNSIWKAIPQCEHHAVKCADETWRVLQMRVRQNMDEPQWPPIWGDWFDVPIEGLE